MEWFQRSITPKIREKDSEKEVEEARERARASGEANVFDYEAPGVVGTDGKAVPIPSALITKPTEVSILYLLTRQVSNKLIPVHKNSIGELQVTSGSPTAS